MREKAFGELHARYHRRIYAYIVRLTNNVDASKDIFQEVFIRFYRSVESGTIPASVIAVLLTTARNLCFNAKRDAKIKVVLDEHTDLGIEMPYRDNELTNVINTALELLEPEYREAIVLRLYQDLSYDEIAAITGETIPTLKNRVWRGKEKLRKILAPYVSEVR